MSVLSKLFTPSGKKFYDLFEEVSGNLEQMAVLFAAFVNERDADKRKQLLDRTEQLEHANDMVTHKLFVELGKNFITPFDREDVHYMASGLDDIADYFWAISKRMHYFDIDFPTDTTEQLAERLVSFVKILATAVNGLRNRRDMEALVSKLKEMRKITAAGDAVISSAVFNLYKDGRDEINAIKLADHYSTLQELNNKCAELINTLENIVIKYA